MRSVVGGCEAKYWNACPGSGPRGFCSARKNVSKMVMRTPVLIQVLERERIRFGLVVARIVAWAYTPGNEADSVVSCVTSPKQADTSSSTVELSRAMRRRCR